MSGSVDVRDPAQAFIDAWRARWPEWAVAQVFIPVDQRVAWPAWFALVEQLLDAAWAHADPRPGEAKLAWWTQELQGWSRGARRHPLGQVLPLGLPAWDALAQALPSLGTARHAHAPDALHAALAPLAQALDHVGAALPGGAGARMPEHWMAFLIERRRLATDPALPDGRPAPVERPATEGGARPARMWLALAHARGGRVGGAMLSPWRAVWVAWRAARNAPVH